MTILLSILGVLLILGVTLVWWLRRAIRHVQIIIEWYSTVDVESVFIIPDNVQYSRKIIGEKLFKRALLEVDMERYNERV